MSGLDSTITLSIALHLLMRPAERQNASRTMARWKSIYGRYHPGDRERSVFLVIDDRAFDVLSVITRPICATDAPPWWALASRSATRKAGSAPKTCTSCTRPA